MSDYPDWHENSRDPIYDRIFKPIEDYFIDSCKRMGLDSIIDLDKIRPKKYKYKKYSGEYLRLDNPKDESTPIGLDDSDELILISLYNPKDDSISINKDLVDLSHYSTYYDYLSLIYTLFHAYTHKCRFLATRPYYKNKKLFIEEMLINAIALVLLSKVVGKDMVEDIFKSEINSAWAEPVPTYSNDIYARYLYFRDIKYLAYDLGEVFAYLLLKTKENKQKKYIKRLLKIKTEDDLRKLVYDLGHDIPEDEEIINYYNLIKNTVEGKAILSRMMVNGRMKESAVFLPYNRN